MSESTINRLPVGAHRMRDSCGKTNRACDALLQKPGPIHAIIPAPLNPDDNLP